MGKSSRPARTCLPRYCGGIASQYADTGTIGPSRPAYQASHYAVVENEVCGVDGVQVITGCTLGNDSLIIDNQGKFAFSWVDKNSGEGYRLLLKVPVWKSNEPLVLHEKVKFGTATPEEKQKFFAMRQERGQELLEMSDQELFQVDKIVRKIPGKPQLFPLSNALAAGILYGGLWPAGERTAGLCRLQPRRGITTDRIDTAMLTRRRSIPPPPGSFLLFQPVITWPSTRKYS